MSNEKPEREIVVHRLDGGDHDEICKHFRRLDADSRRARFLAGISDSGIDKYARDIFCHNSILYGACPGRCLRGIAELRGIRHRWPAKAEAAISVEPDWQNIGIGEALFERMMARAKTRGVRSVELICSRENSRMIHLAKKHQARLHAGRDVIVVVLDPSMQVWRSEGKVAADNPGRPAPLLRL